MGNPFFRLMTKDIRFFQTVLNSPYLQAQKWIK
jgi:hypothetical protein|nr:MAG TPA: hypothetical protein [Bacteriophage sp.]